MWAWTVNMSENRPNFERIWKDDRKNEPWIVSWKWLWCIWIWGSQGWPCHLMASYPSTPLPFVSSPTNRAMRWKTRRQLPLTLGCIHSAWCHFKKNCAMGFISWAIIHLSMETALRILKIIKYCFPASIALSCRAAESFPSFLATRQAAK